MKKKFSIGIIDLNAPVILGITFVSLAILLLGYLTGGATSRFLAVRYTSWLDPMMYLRLFSHVLVHADFSHYIGNILLILVVGPMVEEKYGSQKLLVMFAVTALVTGRINVLFFRNVMLMGASGLVFMLILLASFTNLREGKIPLTVLLVAVLYIGNEIWSGITVQDNISRISHIAGGLCGAGFGFFFHRNKLGNGKRF